MARRLRRTLRHLAPSGCSPEEPTEPNLPIPTDRPAGHRLGQLPIVRATPCGPGGELSAAQIEAYCRDGFLFVSGLVPDDIAAAAAEGMWAQMAAENRNCQPVGAGRDNVRNIDDRGRPTSATWMNRRDVPASWTGDGDYPVKDNARVMAIYTPQWLRAAQQLAEAHAAQSMYPVAQRPKVSRPTGGLAINRFPRHAVGPYPPEVGRQHPDKLLDGYQPHSDYVRSPFPLTLCGLSLPQPARLTTLPYALGMQGWRPDSEERHPAQWRSVRQPVYIQHFCYLQSSSRAGGAGT
eukprot:COSAG04_NODE_530_length_12999_cov_7.702946_17_plen_293_part_00